MSVKIIHMVNQLNIEYDEMPVALDILYSGDFVADVYGNCVARFNTSRLIICNLGEMLPSVLVSYDGAFEIKKIDAYGIDGKKIPSSIEIVDDAILGMRRPVRTADLRQIKDYTQTIKSYKKLGISMLSYKYNDDRTYVTNKGKEIKFDKLSRYEKKLYNKIRERNA